MKTSSIKNLAVICVLVFALLITLGFGCKKKQPEAPAPVNVPPPVNETPDFIPPPPGFDTGESEPMGITEEDIEFYQDTDTEVPSSVYEDELHLFETPELLVE